MSLDIEDSNVEETGKAFTSNYKSRSQFVLVCNSSQIRLCLKVEATMLNVPSKTVSVTAPIKVSK